MILPANTTSLATEKLLTWAVGIYCVIYAFEGVVRWLLNMAGADSFIFVRDIILALPVLLIGLQQFLQRRLHPAFTIYFFVIALHGLVFFLNIGLVAPVIFGAKVFITMLTGALVAPMLMNAGRGVTILFTMLWIVSVIGLGYDKYMQNFPWVGLSTRIGDVTVDISRDWQVEGEHYRAGGFMRSSINNACFLPLVSFLLFSKFKNFFLRVGIAAATMQGLVWSTQKGALIAYAITMTVLFLAPQRATWLMRWALILFLSLTVVLPVAMPGTYMPDQSGTGMSITSFNLRVDRMWPKAWDWIDRRGTFPFGVGLGGISGGMQLYAMNEFNAADNLFVFMYASFGMMALVYLLLIAWAFFRVPYGCTAMDKQAMATLLFIITYGSVLSMLEDQATTLFLGAAIAWIAYERKRLKPPAPAAKAPPPPAHHLLLGPPARPLKLLNDRPGNNTGQPPGQPPAAQEP